MVNNKNETIQFYCEPSMLRTIKVPKIIAIIKLCGGALTFNVYDTMQFEIPTEEQRENLKKTFGIEVKLIEED